MTVVVVVVVVGYNSKLLPQDLFWVLAGVAASAGIGNTVAAVFRVPHEVVKQRLQAGMYENTFQVGSIDGGGLLLTY